MSSNESNGRPRRHAARNGLTSSSSHSSQATSSSSSSRPIRSTRLKASSQINLVDDSSEESGSEDIKQIGSFNPKKNGKSSMTNGSTSSNGCTSSNTNGASNRVDLDKLAKLESITGLSRAEAMQLLEASNNKLEKAIDLHFNSNNNIGSASTNSKASNGAHKRPHNHVDDSSSQDAIYSSDDNVRAPIPQKTEKLLDYDPYALVVEPHAKRVRGVFDGFRNMRGEVNDEDPFEGAASSSNSSKAKSLAALYKPPVDLLFKGSFESSKIEGCKKNKWVLVNVQNQTDFACQCLNRDLWRDDAVKEIIKANFVFVQVYFDSIEGKKLINYYKIDIYPFIAILDPRTGEKVMQFNNTSKLDQFIFCEKVTNFLCDFDTPIKDFNENTEDTNDNDVVQIVDDEDSNSNKNSKIIKASELIKELNGEQPDIIETNSNSSDETVTFKNHKNQKNKLDSEDEEQEKKKEEEEKETKEPYEPKMLRYETPDTQSRDCVLRILYPNGDRLDYCTNGNSKFKDLVEYLNKQKYKKQSHELIERLMPNITAAVCSGDVKASTSKQKENLNTSLSSDLSNLIITNQSRNLFNLDNQNLTFKDLNLFPRVFLLLQEL